jgi:calmodulin
MDGAKESEAKETFALFDKDSDGKLTTKEFALVMRSIGAYPTQAELKKYMADSGKDGQIDLASFMSVCKDKFGGAAAISKEKVIKAFSVFDEEGTGKCSEQELRHVLTNLCEKMEDEEVDELVQMGEVDGGGNIDYKSLVSSVF